MEPTRAHSDNTFTSWDGTKLFFRMWSPKAATQKALILIHRGHEHSGRFIEVVNKLGLDDFFIFAWDMRGHGLSEGKGDRIEDFYVFVRDLDAFVSFITKKYELPLENMVVIGHSVGGVIVSAWVHDCAPSIRAMILATPAFKVKLYIPFSISILRLFNRVKKDAIINSYVKSNMLTHDDQLAKEYAEDKLITRGIAVKILLDLFDVSSEIVNAANVITVPTLLLTAGSDWVVENDVQEKFFDNLSSRLKEKRIYAGFYHSIFHERGRNQPIADMREFILKLFG